MDSADHPMANHSSEEPRYSEIQPIWQFALLCFMSIGIYEIYWVYKKWKFIKKYKKINISPFWRTAFFYWFLHSLFAYIFDLAKDKGYQQKYSSWLLVIAYFVIEATMKLPDPYWWIVVFSFIPLIPAVEAINYYSSKEQPTLQVRTHLSRGEIIFLTICGMCFIVPRLEILTGK